jgi:hypothetical protein
VFGAAFNTHTTTSSNCHRVVLGELIVADAEEALVEKGSGCLECLGFIDHSSYRVIFFFFFFFFCFFFFFFFFFFLV